MRQVRDIGFGMLDCALVMFLFLPFFGQSIGGVLLSAALVSLYHAAVGFFEGKGGRL